MGEVEVESGERCRRFRFPLPPHPIAAEQARLLVKIAITEWEIPEITDEALIIAAELATNAAKLGDVFHITLSRQGALALIEVWDGSEAVPDRRPCSVDRVDGRGLLLVEACSKDWGWRLEHQGGKTVWALVGSCAPSAPRPQPAPVSAPASVPAPESTSAPAPHL